MTISEDVINNICSDEPNPTQVTENENSAIELALEYNIQEVVIRAKDESPPHLSPLLPSPSPPQSYNLSPKAMAAELKVSEEEAENDLETAAEEAAEEKTAEENEDEEEEEDFNLNAREPVNDATRTLDVRILYHQTHRRELMQKKYNASHKVINFKEGDFASMKILIEN